jgi:hypothetical protein
MSTTTTVPATRTAEQIRAAIAEATAERELHKGLSRGPFTKRIKALEAELHQRRDELVGQAVEQVQTEIDESAADEPKAEKPKAEKPKAKPGRWDSDRLVQVVEQADEPLTSEQIAEACGEPLVGSMKTRIRWMCDHDPKRLRQVGDKPEKFARL